MKKSKKAKEAPEVVSGFVSRNTDSPEPSNKSRITLHLGENGIDWDRSSPGTDDELMNAIANDPTMLEKIASHPDFQDGGDGGDPSLELITSSEAGFVLDVLSQVEGMIFSSVSMKLLGMKVSKKAVGDAFTITDKEHQRQDPHAAACLNMLMQYLQLDPKWKPLVFFCMAHGAFMVRAGKDAIYKQWQSDQNTPPTLNQEPEESEPEKVN